jgi:crossover junction endodeoxyribonuclease RuvC
VNDPKGTSSRLLRVLGVDPGLNVTGYGVVDFSKATPRVVEAGVIKSTQRKPLEKRLAELHRGLAEVIESCRPDAMALEELYSHYGRPRTAILMGHARGVLCLAAEEAGLAVTAYSATQIKRILTGSGKAAKDQVQRAVQRELGLAHAPEPPDVADALAAALCHYHLSSRRLPLG